MLVENIIMGIMSLLENISRIITYVYWKVENYHIYHLFFEVYDSYLALILDCLWIIVISYLFA